MFDIYVDVAPFWVGDISTVPITVEVTNSADGTDADLSAYTTATVTATVGNAASTGWTATLSGSNALVHIPTLGFVDPGLYTVQVILSGASNTTSLAPFSFVVQALDGWHNVSSVSGMFGNDFTQDTVQVWTLLECAKLSVLAWAPALVDTYPSTPIPVNYKQAQALQARNILNSQKTDPSTGSDGTLAVIRPYPLDSFIRQLLRPRSLGRFA